MRWKRRGENQGKERRTANDQPSISTHTVSPPNPRSSLPPFICLSSQRSQPQRLERQHPDIPTTRNTATTLPSSRSPPEPPNPPPPPQRQITDTPTSDKHHIRLLRSRAGFVPRASRRPSTFPVLLLPSASHPPLTRAASSSFTPWRAPFSDRVLRSSVSFVRSRVLFALPPVNQFVHDSSPRRLSLGASYSLTPILRSSAPRTLARPRPSSIPRTLAPPSGRFARSLDSPFFGNNN